MELDQAAPLPPADPLGDAIANGASDDEIARAFVSALVAAGRASAERASAAAAQSFQGAARRIMRPAKHDPSGAEGQVATMASNLRPAFEKRFLHDYLTRILGTLNDAGDPPVNCFTKE